MEKKQYISDWYEIDLSARNRVNEIRDEINSIDIIDVNLRYEQLRVPAYFSSAIGALGMITCYALGAQALYWAIFSIIFCLGLIGVIAIISINWNAKKVLRNQFELKKKISSLEDSIENVQNLASHNKYNLTLEFMDKYMSIVDLGEFSSYYERSSVTYGKIKNKQRNKVGYEQLVAIKGVWKVFLGSNEMIVEEREVPVYILKDLTSHYRKSTLNTLIDIENNQAIIVATNDKGTISKLSVADPSHSDKGNYPKKMAELNGEYYPNVSWDSSEIDIFKFFTPRKIVFFKENPNARGIAKIENNSLYYQPRIISINWLEINYTWGVKSAEELIDYVNPFRNDTYPMNISTKQILIDMKKTDTLHR